MGMEDIYLEMIDFRIVILVVAVILMVAIILTGYVKASPDSALVISGLRKKPKVLIGKAGIKIPLLERKDELRLQAISIDVKTANSVPTADYININVDAVVNIQIDTSPSGIELASKNFLNKKIDYIASVAREILEGNMREIIGKMELRQMVNDRQTFANYVSENATPDLKRMGLVIISYNVQNFMDNNNIISDLGIENISQIKKNAQISKANADKEVAIEQSKANEEANAARITSELEIEKQNQELLIRQAELKKIADIKQAEADAAYKIQEEEQRKSIENAIAEADILAKEKQIELHQKAVEVEEKRLDAEVRKKAEAEKYARQQRAEADLYERMKKAEAQQFEREKEAEAKKVEAEAQRFEEEEKAKGIKALGTAEADAIRAKGEAEAESLNKKAEAMKKYGEAAMMEMIVKALPEIANAVAKPLESIDKITIIDSGNGEGGIASMGNYVPGLLSKTIETIKETTGLDIVEIMKAETMEAKTTRNINIDVKDDLVKEKVLEVLDK